ncbi:cleavage stimulation factor subunit 2 [Rhodotorula toruloides]|uniref:Cleavage stimulation factor subunit 2 n=1 Tax=Rhodotorula toruloides TaxID=5286 RepID=A0A511K8N3_RHOTO|nr:cleavage stimulation factor subunit 2 [Rhodotorula toruloides]
MSYGAYGQPQSRSKVVFVGNLPFDYTEEQFIDVFSSVGPVVSFRLVFDHATGKPKGFGFCEYRDADTAASAIRNLQGVEVGGRGLRLDFADTEDAPPSKRFRGGAGGPPGGMGGPPGGGGGYGGAYGGGGGGGGGGYGSMPPAGPPIGGVPGAGVPIPPPGREGGIVVGPPAGGYNIPPPVPGATGPRPLPAGVPVEPGKSATDKITETIGTMAPGQLLDIMSQMKALVTASPYEARALLTAQPQLSYALFQAMLCMGIVDPAILQASPFQRVCASILLLTPSFPQKTFPGAAGAAPPAAPAPSAYPAIAPAPAPSAYGGYNAPPPSAPSYATPPHQPSSYPPPGGVPASYSRPPPASYNGPSGGAPPPQPVSYTGYPQSTGQPKASYNGPSSASQQAPLPPAALAPGAGAGADQAALIQQVLSMTDAQIAALDETSRNTVLQIRQQAQRAMGR